MRNAVRNAVKGRAGVVIGVVALVAALSGSAIALPGANSVDKGDIKKNAVSAKKALKVAYLFIDDDESIVRQRGVKSFDFVTPTDQVLCLDLKFKPVTGSATRSANSGGDDPFTPPHIGIGPVAQSLCGTGPRSDAVVQIPGSSTSGGTYVNFLG